MKSDKKFQGHKNLELKQQGTCHTMEQVLSKGVIWHVFSNKQPLVPITAVTYQIGQPLVPQLAHSPCFLLHIIVTKQHGTLR